jgi:hypothetical protein
MVFSDMAQHTQDTCLQSEALLLPQKLISYHDDNAAAVHTPHLPSIASSSHG